ncbi:16S rRNA (cytidine(1402)-2'-O)-methyltransferase, partial [Microvirga sp. 3-52]|nr:16S rRNA (cytidine(1402)-2'-O)-methyltransferase [Microvirga sp. 3-52]
FCIVLEGNDGSDSEEVVIAWWDGLSVSEHVSELIERKGIRSKEAIREVASERAMSRRDVYRVFHVEKD